VKKNKYKPLFLGISTLVITGFSYVILSTNHQGQDKIASTSIEVTLPIPSNPNISSPVIAVKQTPLMIPDPLVYTIKKGDNLSKIFAKLNLSKFDLYHITHANKLGRQFAQITPGKTLIAQLNSEGELQQLQYKKDTIDTLIASKKQNKFEVNLVSKVIDTEIHNTQVTINSSLFLDGKNAGLSDQLIMKLAEIFAWDIDFALDLRKGDQFTIVYEKSFVEGKQINDNHILSAEFINQGQAYTAVRFEDKQGNIDYFTPEGKSLRTAFLRTPVDYARISSPFNLKRKHPVLNRIRAHKGVDYAARTGTPIKTTGDGKITYRGRKGGYGRVVIVQHGQQYSTLYAHMSGYKKGQRVGSSVKQGQIIGYVGQSGLATGPHLHYEFRINGIHRNPLTVKLPHAQPIKKSLLAEFKQQTQPLLTQLTHAKASTLLAKN